MTNAPKEKILSIFIGDIEVPMKNFSEEKHTYAITNPLPETKWKAPLVPPEPENIKISITFHELYSTLEIDPSVFDWCGFGADGVNGLLQILRPTFEEFFAAMLKLNKKED